jgi:hypothetical protein
MRARTLQRIWNKFHIAIGIGFAVAILLLCSRMLYLAYSKQPILAVARYVGWVIYDSHPRWFVTSVFAYCLILVLSLIWAIAGVAVWRRERAMEQRRRTAPPLEHAIRSDVNSR